MTRQIMAGIIVIVFCVLSFYGVFKLGEIRGRYLAIKEAKAAISKIVKPIGKNIIRTFEGNQEINGKLVYYAADTQELLDAMMKDDIIRNIKNNRLNGDILIKDWLRIQGRK